MIHYIREGHHRRPFKLLRNLKMRTLHGTFFFALLLGVNWNLCGFVQADVAVADETGAADVQHDLSTIQPCPDKPRLQLTLRQELISADICDGELRAVMKRFSDLTGISVHIAKNVDPAPVNTSFAMLSKRAALERLLQGTNYAITTLEGEEDRGISQVSVISTAGRTSRLSEYDPNRYIETEGAKLFPPKALEALQGDPAERSRLIEEVGKRHQEVYERLLEQLQSQGGLDPLTASKLREKLIDEEN